MLRDYGALCHDDRVSLICTGLYQQYNLVILDKSGKE